MILPSRTDVYFANTCIGHHDTLQTACYRALPHDSLQSTMIPFNPLSTQILQIEFVPFQKNKWDQAWGQRGGVRRAAACLFRTAVDARAVTSLLENTLAAARQCGSGALGARRRLAGGETPLPGRVMSCRSTASGSITRSPPAGVLAPIVAQPRQPAARRGERRARRQPGAAASGGASCDRSLQVLEGSLHPGYLMDPKRTSGA